MCLIQSTPVGMVASQECCLNACILGSLVPYFAYTQICMRIHTPTDPLSHKCLHHTRDLSQHQSHPVCKRTVSGPYIHQVLRCDRH